MNARLPARDVVLIGAGHTHAHVLRMWRMKPPKDVRLTCLTNFYEATYSGMLPGTLAGLYEPRRMAIDLVRFCASAGVRLVLGEWTGLNLQRREVLLADRPPLPYDVLSVGIGSVPRGSVLDANGRAASDDCLNLAIKPMQTFLGRLERQLRCAMERSAGRPLRVAVVGAGVAGIEITLAMPARVRALDPRRECELFLVDRHDQVTRGLNDRAQRLILDELDARRVTRVLGSDVRGWDVGGLELEDGTKLEVDIALWATSAKAPEILRRLDLPTDDAGFLLTRPNLQTTADQPIFVVGDSGTIAASRTPKAGVYAVRQGRVLWQNLQRQLRGESLVQYKPQSGFLKLLSTGDGRAILDYRGMAAHGRWCWKLKDWIDGRFMDKYQDYEPMEMKPDDSDATSAVAMRCAGCGGKVGPDVLSRVLARLDVPPAEHVVVGLAESDDAAIVRTPAGGQTVVTTDFFTAFLDDPYLVGRIAALNAASDVFALGARPRGALAMATLPLGSPRQQEQLLYELLAGGLRELTAMGAALVGGHTIEGPQAALGFTILADAPAQPTLKSGLRPGDHLLLTKPLGSGTLLAAQMQAKCRSDWFAPLVENMLRSNEPPPGLFETADIRAVTDVTGFGLAGHLLEMLRASGATAEICLADVPLLPGAREMLAEGIESTLAPANRSIEDQIETAAGVRERVEYRSLFDPQTSGGLLLGVVEQQLSHVLDQWEQHAGSRPTVIGRAVDRGDDDRVLLRVR